MPQKKNIDGYPWVAYQANELTPEESIEKSDEYYKLMDKRRSVRHFSPNHIDKKVIENIIKTASTAPSGAHKQPWNFYVVSNEELKKKIKIAAEKEEYISYSSRMSAEWLKDLEPLGTDWHKEFLQIAPYLIIMSKKVYDLDAEGNKKNNYYVNESVGIAAGFLLSAIHQAGLVSLTHTPSPMNFLADVLNMPSNERPYLLIPIGYPTDDTFVPDLNRKPLNEVCTFLE